MNKFDVIVIGGGPGGYVAAIRAAQLGKNVAIVESNHLGGVCLNWGCIPTKALLKNADVLEIVKNASKYGIEIPEYTVKWSKVIKRSRDVARRLNKGIEFLMKKNKITYIPARGKLINATTVQTTTDEGGVNQISAEKIIIATGARPKWFPGMEPDGDRVITSKEAMVQEEQPKSLIIIGAGAIGIEFAHFYNTYRTDVTVIEALPTILPVEDEDVSKELLSIFKKRKMNILTNTFVEKIERLKTKVKVHTKDGQIIEADKALIAVGVQGNIEDIGLEEVEVSLDKGWISTNGFMQTNIEGIYAIGDVAGPPWLAHVASEEGIIAAEHLAGENPEPMKYDNIPGCTYCHPEVASVGLTEKAARDAGYELKIGNFPFRALGKAMAVGDTDGFVKVIYDAKYGELLGCHIIGAEATNLITEAGIARKLEATWHEVLTTIHPHPTLSEAIMEATADAFGEAVHI
ncbi:MAG: dihydrolipoyl dehydrogenase [Candidatus Marinimicrobia bacterium]|nr:dihydrolipoyl dehydrogenase [Candidatus Neomarinimicrobiota bacterium]MBT6870238.1 dihydrolipoyl dehydrogenase [Candidatus Neomarinimicrobiota bacterium]